MNIIVQYILTGCGIAGACGILWGQIVSRGRTESGEIIKFYKEQATEYKTISDAKSEKHAEQIKSMSEGHTTQIRELTKEFNEKYTKLSQEFGEIQGKYKVTQEILQGKDPETKEFMTQSLSTLGEIKDFMEKINQHMEDEKKREIHIDANITKT